MSDAIVNYSELEEAIKNARPYKHGSSRAILHSGTSYDTYTVFSFDTPMLELRREPGYHGGNWYVLSFNNKKSSKTTTRLQNIIIRYWHCLNSPNYWVNLPDSRFASKGDDV